MTTRTTLGLHFSEGARLAWLALRERGWNATILRAQLTGRGGAPLGGGVVDRWLYGDSRPSVTSAGQIEALLGVPASAWGLPPRRRFALDAARRAHATRLGRAVRPRKLNARQAIGA